MKPLCEMIFKEIDGMWQNISDKNGAILADVINAFELQIDDKCEFARFKDYDNNLSIWYRRNGGKIVLTLWQLN